MIELDEDLKQRIDKMIQDYINNNVNVQVNYYVDDWGELLDTVEYLLEKLKEK